VQKKRLVSSSNKWESVKHTEVHSQGYRSRKSWLLIKGDPVGVVVIGYED
jgi:hypothetical protein